ncbi:uncharacterized protein [Pleurodeles waltl]|uniref:uncharacterized protein isoform X2 n=1 Tax=Pleurodeles waltl TaxID=8319 RepID=UPI003709C24B
MGHLEAIVSNIKLYDSSLQSLKPTEWIVDEVPFEDKETVLCPTNTGIHWLLLVLKPTSRKLLLYDSMMGSLPTYTNLLLNWRAFLQAVKYPDNHLWELTVQSSPKQIDIYNCGIFCVLVMRLLF